MFEDDSEDDDDASFSAFSLTSGIVKIDSESSSSYIDSGRDSKYSCLIAAVDEILLLGLHRKNAFNNSIPLYSSLGASNDKSLPG